MAVCFGVNGVFVALDGGFYIFDDLVFNFGFLSVFLLILGITWGSVP